MSITSQRAARELAGGGDRGDSVFEGLATVMAASVPVLFWTQAAVMFPPVAVEFVRSDLLIFEETTGRAIAG